MAPKFFLMLLPLFFCLTITTCAQDTANPTNRRLLHLDFHPLSHPQPSTGAGLLIKNACLDTGLDYLGRLCSDILGSAPPPHDFKHEANALAIFALQMTDKIMANASVQVKEGLAKYGQGMDADLSAAFTGCADTWYVQAQSQVDGAIAKLETDCPNAHVDATNAIDGAVTHIKTCYFDLAGKKFVQGDSRVLVNQISGHNQLLKRMLAAARTLIHASDV